MHHAILQNGCILVSYSCQIFNLLFVENEIYTPPCLHSEQHVK